MTRSLARFSLLLGALLVFSMPARAQELRCNVTVGYASLGGTEFTFLGDLKNHVEEYLNTRSWTQDIFDDRERIECSMQITITEAEGLDRFRAQISVSSSRPIYASGQRTTVFVVRDSQWNFQYNRGASLIHNPSRFDPLTSLLDFYAYVILGYDYDTFSELGGQPHFERAREIASLAEAQSAPGWTAIGDDRSRISLIRQLLDPRYVPLRKAYFQYHYGCLDHFVRNQEQAWAAGAEAMHGLFELFNEVSRKYATDVFFATKVNELPRVFEDAPTRSDIYGLLIQMDPSNQSTYDGMIR
jgi:hypothetical protein